MEPPYEANHRFILLKKSNGTDFPKEFRKHFHTHLYCHRGKVTFGQGEEQGYCQRGEFVFWLAENHSTPQLAFSADFQATVLFVEDQFMNDNVPDQNWGIDAVLHARKYPVKKLDNKTDKERVLSNFVRIYQLYQDHTHRFYEEALKLQMRLFILEMWHTFANEYERRTRTLQSGSLYERFIHLVETHCRTEREVQFYARQLFITPKHLNYICKQNSSVSASEWIQRYAREQLLLLLQNKNLNIAEITDEMNFSSRSFFTRYTKKTIGMTPSEYRNRLR